MEWQTCYGDDPTIPSIIKLAGIYVVERQTCYGDDPTIPSIIKLAGIYVVERQTCYGDDPTIPSIIKLVGIYVVERQTCYGDDPTVPSIIKLAGICVVKQGELSGQLGLLPGSGVSGVMINVKSPLTLVNSLGGGLPTSHHLFMLGVLGTTSQGPSIQVVC